MLSQSLKDEHSMIPLKWVPTVVKFRETGTAVVVARLGEGEGHCCLVVAVLPDENVLEL